HAVHADEGADIKDRFACKIETGKIVEQERIVGTFAVMLEITRRDMQCDAFEIAFIEAVEDRHFIPCVGDLEILVRPWAGDAPALCFCMLPCAAIADFTLPWIFLLLCDAEIMAA